MTSTDVLLMVVRIASIVADDLADVAGLTTWLQEHAESLW
jgi:hypothetical protein